MIHDEHPHEGVLSRELRDAVSDFTVHERPALEAIVARGRVYRRRQRGGLASIAVAAAAGALALALTGFHTASPRSTTSTKSTGGKPGTIRTASFTLVSYANGKAKLTLNNRQVFNPSALRRALAHDGIPALVKTDVYCVSNPAAPDPNEIGVLSMPRGFGRPGLPLRKATGSPNPSLGRLINHTIAVIDPAKLPVGTEIAFDYAPGEHLLAVDLVYVRSHTCRSGQPPVG